MSFATTAAFFVRGRLHALRRIDAARAIAQCGIASDDCVISYFPTSAFDVRSRQHVPINVDVCLPCGATFR